MTQLTRQPPPLNKYVKEALEAYFEKIDGHKITDLYEMVLKETEAPLFRSVMKYTENNQSNAALILGINRGTLRKKLKQYKLS